MKLKAIKVYLLLIVLIGFFTLPLLARDTDDDNDIHDLLYQRDFNDGAALPWHVSESNEENSDFEVVDGEFVIHVYDGGQNKWDVQIRHRGLVLEKGHEYTVKFKVHASASTNIYAKIGSQGAPYNEYWNNNWSNIEIPAGETVEINETFTMDKETDNLAEFAFHLGGSIIGSTPIDIFFDDIHLEDPEYIRPEIETRIKPDVRVNQVGYFPEGKKKATILSASTSPIDWFLKNSSGTTVLTGTTTVFGDDNASGDHVHIADFSSYTTAGSDYTMSIDMADEDKAISHTFDIADNIYSEMKYDAFSYFYHNRSGIAIEMPYAGREDLTRAGGHMSDIMATWPGTGQENYSLDVSKGWYDAGDHGKYVVNGGISVWTMMNQYERTLYIENADSNAYADGNVNIPEKGNGYPDILDETRWQMEMLLGMQVPENNQLAGMVHHKGHDEEWTPLAVEPADDPETRYLRPVSTAATLNLAATASQSARLWADLDSDFSEECLIAAERAWEAAMENPAIYAPVHKIGGGPYNDEHVEDEFYWAACELFITTGKAVYKKHMENSEYYLEIPTILSDGEDSGLSGVFTWGNTQGLGTVSLALVPSSLSSSDRDSAIASIQTAADHFIDTIENEGYRLPLEISQTTDGYPWGSNSFIINDMIIMAYAFDYTGSYKYIDGMTESMDYILGRNAMDQCYVTGYGEAPLENPHHRFWAFQANPDFPKPAAGAISGGPNSGLEDPWVQGAGMEGTVPQKCFMDHIESWSTNEITINWNAPFAWVTAFLDEKKTDSDLSVSLTSPVSGSKINTGDIQLKASASGDVTAVKFYIDGTLLGSDSSIPYEYTWQNVPIGNYSITAEAIGTDGTTAMSSPVSIEVMDNLMPVVELTQPVNGANFGLTDSVILAATADDSDGSIAYVDFMIDGQLVYTDNSAPYGYIAGLMAIGTYDIVAIAVDDKDGKTTSAPATISVTDVTLIYPVVNLTAPADDTNFDEGQSIIISADASDEDGTVTKVEFYVDSVKIGEIDATPYQYNWSGGSKGQHTISAKAIDNDGLVTSTTPVKVMINEVIDDSDLVIQTLTNNAGDNANQISGKINIINNGTSDVALKDLTLRYFYSKEKNVQQNFNCYYAVIGNDNVEAEFKTVSGEHFFELSFTGGTVLAKGSTGEIQYAINNADWTNYIQSNDYSFSSATSYTDNSKVTLFKNGTLAWGEEPDGSGDNEKPSVSITSPSDNAQFKEGDLISIKTTATDSDGTVTKVDFYNGTDKLNSDTSVPYEYTLNNLKKGTYTLKTVATDNSGNTETDSINITVDEDIVDEGIELPGSFQAEDYDDYYDTTEGNAGGAYKNDNVDIEICDEGGYNIGWIESGEWLAYNVNVKEPGAYEVSLRTARETGGDGSLIIKLDNQDVSSPITIGSTGGWQSYKTVKKSGINLTAGTHVMKISMENGPFNLNWVEFKKTGNEPEIPNVTITAPADGSVFTVGDDISVKADASDADGIVTKVVFYDGTTLLGTDTIAPYEHTIINASEGIYNLKAVATDDDDNNGNSAISTVTVNSAGDTDVTLTVTIYADAGETKSVLLSPVPDTGSSLITGVNGYKQTVTYTGTPVIMFSTSDGISSWSGAVSGNTSTISLSTEAGKGYQVNANFTTSSPGEGDWLHTMGSKIVDRNGNEVWLTGANWFGFNTGTNAFDGLWSCNLEEAISAMADRGINLLRIPISTQLLLEWKSGNPPISPSINEAINPGLKGKNSLEIFDITVAHCDKVGMKIMLDVHSPGSDAMGHIDPLWYKGTGNEDDFISGWVWFAERYKNNDTIIAYDLENEPHGHPWANQDNYARWDGSDHLNNWKRVAEKSGKAILAVNPNALIMVEGIEITPKAGYTYDDVESKTNFDFNWWGGNLRAVKDHPVDLGANQDQLVYSPHDYGPKVHMQDWFKKDFTKESLYEDCWGPNWAYIMKEDIAPLLIGEWGGFMDGGDNQKWMEFLRDYIVENRIHHTFWCFNANSGDTGGLVDHDFKTWDEEKYALLKPALWQSGGKFVGLDHDVILGTNGTNIGELYGD